MACLASCGGIYRHDLDTELHLPRTRLVRGDYALVPVTHSHRVHSDRPLSHYYNEDTALDAHCALRPRATFGGVTDASLIDRTGPFDCHSCVPRCRGVPHIHDDTEYLELPDPNWRFSYTYPLQCMEAGGVRWSPDQIHAYNREVLRHNNLIARKRAVGAPGEYMMLHPMMDPHGRFPPGFDRPLMCEEFLNMDGKQHSHSISHCQLSASSCLSNTTTTP
jgi:hypothetical protein